jgi:hypothetical protein
MALRISEPVQEYRVQRHALWRNLRNPLIIVILIIAISVGCEGHDSSVFGGGLDRSTSR